MAALPDTVTNLTPSSTKEWLMHINTKLDAVMESQAEDRDILLGYMAKQDTWVSCHEKDRISEARQFSTLVEKVDHLEKRVNGWNILNSFGVVVAAIMAALGLKGS